MKIKGWQCPICHTNILGDKEVEKHKLQHPDNPKAFCHQHGYPLPCTKCGLREVDQARHIFERFEKCTTFEQFKKCMAEFEKELK